MARLDVGKSVVPRSVVTSCSSSPASPTGPQRSQHVMALCLAYSRAVPRHACPLARDSNADPSTDPLDHSIFCRPCRHDYRVFLPAGFPLVYPLLPPPWRELLWWPGFQLSSMLRRGSCRCHCSLMCTDAAGTQREGGRRGTTYLDLVAMRYLPVSFFFGCQLRSYKTHCTRGYLTLEDKHLCANADMCPLYLPTLTL